MCAHEDDVITVEVTKCTSRRRVHYATETVITSSECATLKHAARLSVL